MSKNPEPIIETLAETDDYLVWKAEEPDDETTYHVELGNVTVHFYKEEWDEFLESLKDVEKIKPAEDGIYELEVPNALIFLDEQEWQEFKLLVGELE